MCGLFESKDVGEKNKNRKKLWEKPPFLSTVGAGILCLFVIPLDSNTSVDEMMYPNESLLAPLQEAGSLLSFVCLFGLLISLLIGGMVSIFKRRFIRAFSLCYTVSVPILAGTVVLLVFFLSQSNSRKQSTKSHEEKIKKQMVNDLENDIQLILNTSEDLGGISDLSTFEFAADIQPTNDFQRMRLLMQSFHKDYFNILDQYNRDIKASGLTNILNPTRLTTDQTFQESRAMLVEFKMLTKETRSNVFNLFSDIPNRMNQYQFTFPGTILDGIQDSLNKNKTTLQEFWDLEFQVLDHTDEIINFLEKTHQNWTVEEEEFVFDKEEDFERFNEFQNKIEACCLRQDEIRSKSQNTRTKQIDNFKKKVLK